MRTNKFGTHRNLIKNCIAPNIPCTNLFNVVGKRRKFVSKACQVNAAFTLFQFLSFFLNIRFFLFFIFFYSCSNLELSVRNFDVFSKISGCKFLIFSLPPSKKFVGLSYSSVYVTSILSKSFGCKHSSKFDPILMKNEKESLI